MAVLCLAAALSFGQSAGQIRLQVKDATGAAVEAAGLIQGLATGVHRAGSRRCVEGENSRQTDRELYTARRFENLGRESSPKGATTLTALAGRQCFFVIASRTTRQRTWRIHMRFEIDTNAQSVNQFTAEPSAKQSKTTRLRARTLR